MTADRSPARPEHGHNWHLPDGPFVVIDTFPEQYPYVCECGAFTHDPATGTPCQTCAPVDYAQRGPTINLRGGPFDGKQIARPVNQDVLIRCDDPDKRIQKHVRYEQTEDPSVWTFRWNGWTVPFEERS